MLEDCAVVAVFLKLGREYPHLKSESSCDYIITWREKEVPRLLRPSEGSSPVFFTPETENEVNHRCVGTSDGAAALVSPMLL